MANAATKIRELNLLDLRRAARLKVKRGRPLPRPPRILFPSAVERSYAKSLKNMVRAMRAAVDAKVVPHLESVIAQAQARRPVADARLDDYGDAISNLLELARADFFGQWSDAEIAAMVSKIGDAIEAKNGVEIGKVFTSVLGVDLFKAEPWMHAEAQAFVKSNVALISTISDNYFSRVESLVFDGARQGLAWRDVADSLGEQFGVSSRRGAVIARDQVGKFHGQLSELRQTQAGVEKYTWRGTLDARERASHRALEGKVFRWDDPPLVDGERVKPGQAIMCRCWAEPVLNDLIDGVA
jgi:SPP1 gp7 family putative phage head morphogenesis protein